MQVKQVAVWLTAHLWSVGVSLGERQRGRHLVSVSLSHRIVEGNAMKVWTGVTSPGRRYHPGICRYYSEQGVGARGTKEAMRGVWMCGEWEEMSGILNVLTPGHCRFYLFRPFVCFMFLCVKTGLAAGTSFEKCECKEQDI